MQPTIKIIAVEEKMYSNVIFPYSVLCFHGSTQYLLKSSLNLQVMP